MIQGMGCKNCPASKGCTANYRGSACAARRAKVGVESDPLTNAEFLAQKTTDVHGMAKYLCQQGWHATELKDCEEWLTQTFEPGGELDVNFDR